MGYPFFIRGLILKKDFCQERIHINRSVFLKDKICLTPKDLKINHNLFWKQFYKLGIKISFKEIEYSLHSVLRNYFIEYQGCT